MMWNEEKILYAKNLLESGQTYKKIGSLLGCSDMAVRAILLRKFNITRTQVHSFYTEKQCKTCTKKFIVIKSAKQQFCSKSCAATYNNLHRIKNLKSCPHCQKSFTKFTKYCSKQCESKNKWNLQKQKILTGKITAPRSLKKYLLELYGHKCSICELSIWNDKPIPLVLDHIDGRSINCLPRNLRLICPNCDHQLDTFAGKNIGNGTRIRYYLRKTDYEKQK